MYASACGPLHKSHVAKAPAAQDFDYQQHIKEKAGVINWFHYKERTQRSYRSAFALTTLAPAKTTAPSMRAFALQSSSRTLHPRFGGLEAFLSMRRFIRRSAFFADTEVRAHSGVGGRSTRDNTFNVTRAELSNHTTRRLFVDVDAERTRRELASSQRFHRQEAQAERSSQAPLCRFGAAVAELPTGRPIHQGPRGDLDSVLNRISWQLLYGFEVRSNAQCLGCSKKPRSSTPLFTSQARRFMQVAICFEHHLIKGSATAADHSGEGRWAPPPEP